MVEPLVPGRRVARVLLGDDEVEVAGRGAPQRRLRLVLHHLDPHVGMVAPHPGEGLRQQREGGRLEDREPHRTGGDLGPRRHLRLRPLEQREDLAGTGGERLRLRRERDAPPGGDEQRDPDLPLEQVELLRDGGRAVAERRGHLGERAAVGELLQQAQPSDVVHRAPLVGGTERYS